MPLFFRQKVRSQNSLDSTAHKEKLEVVLAGAASHVASRVVLSGNGVRVDDPDAARVFPYSIIISLLIDILDCGDEYPPLPLHENVLHISLFSPFFDALGDRLEDGKSGPLTTGQLRIYIRSWLDHMDGELRATLLPNVGVSAWLAAAVVLEDMRAGSVVIAEGLPSEDQASVDVPGAPDDSGGGAAAALPSAAEAIARSISIGMLAQGGALSLLAVLEPLLGPHVDPAARLGGAIELVKDLACKMDPTFDRSGGMDERLRALVSASSAEAVASELVCILKESVPAPELYTMPQSWLAARRQLGVMLSTAGPMGLRLSNLAGALEWFASLRTLVTGATAGEAWALLESLMLKSEVSSGELTLAKLRILHGVMDPLVRHMAPDVLAAMAPDGRVCKVIALLGERKAADKTASKDTSIGGSSGRVGYPRAFRQAMLQHVDKAAVITLYARVESLLAEGAHPHEAISEVFAARDPLLWHALCRVKDVVPEAPAVKLVADHLRGDLPEYLGFAGFELLTVEEIQEHDDGEYPKCSKLGGVIESGELGKLDLENDWLREVLLFYTGEAFPAVPETMLYADLGRLRTLHKAVNCEDGFMVRIGWNEEPSLHMVIGEAIGYLEGAITVPYRARQRTVHDYILGVLKERGHLHANALKRGDPGDALGGALVVPNSPSRRTFKLLQAQAGGNYVLRKQLLRMGFRPDAAASVHRASAREADPNGSLAPPGLRAAEPTDGSDKEGGKPGPKANKDEGADAELLAKRAEIGMFSSRVKVDPTIDRVTFSDQAGAEVESFKYGESLRAIPEGGCLGTYLSRSRTPWKFCTCPPDASAEEQARHATLRGGAHAVAWNWRTKWLKLLTVVAMAGSGEAAVMAPRASASSAVARAQVGVVPSVALPFGSGRAQVLMPMLYADGGAYLGLPAGRGPAVFGTPLEDQSRDAHADRAARWGEALFADCDQAHFFHLWEEHGDEGCVVYGGPLRDPLPAGWEASVVHSWEEIARAEAEPCWMPMSTLACLTSSSTSDAAGHALYELGLLSRLRLDAFARPERGMPAQAKLGAMGEAYLNPKRLLIKGKARLQDRASIAAATASAMAAVRASLESCLLLPGLSDSRLLDLRHWLEVASRPVMESDMGDALWDQAFAAEDPRLGLTPFPNGAVPVATAPMAPLPPPPPVDAIPPDCTEWHHVFYPRFYRAAVKCQLDSRAYWRGLCQHESTEGLSKASFTAFGIDGCRPWARKLVEAGWVIIKTPTGLALLDMSRPPKFTLHPEFWGRILAKSKDHALRDALTTHGVSYFASHSRCPLPPQLVMDPPNEKQGNLASAARSLLQSTREMAEWGWFDCVRAERLDEGVLDILSFPGRYQCVSAVPRSIGPWRGLIDSTSPRDKFTTIGKRAPVPALNPSTGTRADRAMRKVEMGNRVRKPAVVGVQHAQSAPPYQVPVLLPGSPGGCVLPPELKGYFHQLMVAVCIVAYLASLCDTHAIVTGDDMTKFFHQFATCVAQWWACQQMVVDPADVSDGQWEAALCLVWEKCMSMGTTPSSSYAQRAMTEFCLYIEETFTARVAERVAARRRKYPAFDAAMQRRAELGRSTGFDEERTIWCRGYTDDAVSVVFACYAGDHAIVWGDACEEAGFKRAQKDGARFMGVRASWVGGEIHTTGLLAFISRAKALKAADGLRAAIAALLTVKQFYELAGLMHHLVYILVFERTIMYNFYDGMDTLRAAASGGEPDDDANVPVTPKSAAAFERLLKRVLNLPGCSALSAILQSTPSPAAVRWVLHSDAALRGVGKPALCGNLYDRVYILPLQPAWLTLPIVALEFAAQAVLNLMVFGHLLVGAELISMPGDSLVAPTVLASKARGSPLLVWMHMYFLEMPETKQLFDSLVCSQEFGVSNIVTDAGSRGKEGVLHAVSTHLGWKLTVMDVPERGVAFLDEAARVYASYTPQERERCGAVYGAAAQNAEAAAGSHSTSVHLGTAAQSVAAPNMPIAQRMLLVLAGVLAAHARGGMRVPVVPVMVVLGMPWGASAADEPPSAPSACLPLEDGLPPTARSLVLMLNAAGESRCDALAAAIAAAARNDFGVGRELNQLAYALGAAQVRTGTRRALIAELRLLLGSGGGEAGLAGSSRSARFNWHARISALLEECQELASRAIHGQPTAHGALGPPPAAVSVDASQGEGGSVTAARSISHARALLPVVWVGALHMLACSLAGMVVLGCLLPWRGGSAMDKKELRRPSARAARGELGARGSRGGRLTALLILGSVVACKAMAPPAATTVAPRGWWRARSDPPPLPSPQLSSATSSGLRAAPGRAAHADPRRASAPAWLSRPRLALSALPRSASSGSRWLNRPMLRFGAARTNELGVDSTVGQRPSWEQALLQDPSPLALRPANPDQFAGLLEDMRSFMEHSYAAGTNDKDRYHWAAWVRVCRELGTPAWRTDMAANSGADPVGYRREMLLGALAFIMMYANMCPRSHASPAPNPRSCLNKIYAVGRVHKKSGFQMAPFTLAVRVMKGMLHKYVEDNGVECLVPARKCPLTHALIDAMCTAPEGAARAGSTLRVAWGTPFWVAVRATFMVLAETGMRKADVSKATRSTPFKKGRLTFASVVWRIGGERVPSPSAAQLATLGQHAGDGCWLVFGALKNDPFGEYFGAKPAWLPFSALATRNAARGLAELERLALAAGCTGEQRAATPLFGPCVGEEWHHSAIEEIFDFLLEVGGGLRLLAERRQYSLHSFRIHLACALYAAKCPNDRIMAILRWRSEEALAIYARMNDDERTSWVQQAMQVEVNSTVTAHLPRIDPDSVMAGLHDSIVSGDLGRAARDADDGTLVVDDDPSGGMAGEGPAPPDAGLSAAAAVAAAVGEREAAHVQAAAAIARRVAAPSSAAMPVDTPVAASPPPPPSPRSPAYVPYVPPAAQSASPSLVVLHASLASPPAPRRSARNR